MKILVAYQSAWWNAPAYYTYTLIQALQYNGHQVYFAGRSDTPASERIKLLNVEICNVDLYPSLSNFRKSYLNMKKFVKDKNINVLMPVSAPSHIFLGILKFRQKNKLPLIKFCLDNIPPKKHLLNKYLHNKLTDKLVFPGKATLRRYEGYFRTKGSEILHAPIDADRFCNYENKIDIKDYYKLPKDKIIVSFIGRFSPEKGIFFLLEIIKKVTEKSDSAYFVLSGSEEQIKYAEVKKRINKLGIQNFVKIINKVEDVRELISITDIGLLSSRYSEYICRIALEFMAFKVPVVAPEINVIPEVIEDKHNGYIYPAEDFNQASDFVLALVKNNDLRFEMGQKGYQRILDHYSLKIFADKIENIINKVSKSDSN